MSGIKSIKLPVMCRSISSNETNSGSLRDRSKSVVWGEVETRNLGVALCNKPGLSNQLTIRADLIFEYPMAPNRATVERARTQSGPGNPAEKQARMWDVLIYDKETERAMYEQDQTTTNKAYSLRAL
jgi:hypothetical protein